MLVLSRKRGERIVIGPNIELMVIDIRGDNVRLGFCAPLEVVIHRQEVFQRVQLAKETETGLLIASPALPVERATG